MTESLTDFIRKYLSVLGLSGDDLDSYMNKVLITAMGKAVLALNLSDDEKSVLEREVELAQMNPDSAVGALDRALPDGRHVELFGGMVAESLVELADSLKDSIDEETAKKLAAVVDGYSG